ncbi:hypothetical protein C2G38_2234438 [Gigaspora rosea]|uniref:Uncharacterized protein n=1 Tax=Gigaspora rosea TaxID=44941 RepID=A0A397TSJ1_9GLOM|nr:hypothetical protein C2G38_2234438 [Gigaspora rosea]
MRALIGLWRSQGIYCRNHFNNVWVSCASKEELLQMREEIIRVNLEECGLVPEEKVEKMQKELNKKWRVLNDSSKTFDITCREDLQFCTGVSASTSKRILDGCGKSGKMEWQIGVEASSDKSSVCKCIDDRIMWDLYGIRGSRKLAETVQCGRDSTMEMPMEAGRLAVRQLGVQGVGGQMGSGIDWAREVNYACPSLAMNLQGKENLAGIWLGNCW